MNRTLHLGEEGKKYASKNVLLPCGQGLEVIENLEPLLDKTIVSGRSGYWDFAKGEYNGTDVTIATTGMGGPSAAILIEELKYLGAEKFIRVGTCGGLKRGMVEGDLVIPDRIEVGTDGTSLSYKLSGKDVGLDYARPDKQLTEELMRMAESKVTRFHIGTVKSDDGFYNIIDYWKTHPSATLEMSEEGIIAIEMECSAIFNVAKSAGARAAAILVADSELLEKTHKSYDKVGSYQEAGRIALEALSRTQEQ